MIYANRQLQLQFFLIVGNDMSYQLLLYKRNKNLLRNFSKGAFIFYYIDIFSNLSTKHMLYLTFYLRHKP